MVEGLDDADFNKIWKKLAVANQDKFLNLVGTG